MNQMQKQVYAPLDSGSMSRIAEGFKLATMDSHFAAVRCGWYHDPKTGEKKVMNKGERLMLMVSEIAEAMEGVRKNLMDDKLPYRKMVEVEMADLLIRVFDFAGAEELDLGGAYLEKRKYNDNRADHKPENRLKEGGKAF